MLELSYKKILAIALPLMFGTFVQSVVMLTDTAFVSSLGTTAFNAVNNAGLIYVSLFMFSKGLADGAQILIARKYGEGENLQIGSLIFHTQILQIALSGILFLVFFFLSSVFIEWIVKSQATGEQMVLFLKYRSWGIFFAGMHASLTAFLIGIGRTNMVLVSTLVMAFSNIFLDYAMIFGHAGFPALGMIGAPIASSIAEFLAFVVLLVYILTLKEFTEFRIRIFQKLYFQELRTLLKLGIPLMFQGFIALAGWLLFFTLIEREMSGYDLEVSGVVRAVYFIVFIPIFGFGATTRTYVSNLIGQNKPELIPLIQRKIILLSMAFILFFCHGPVLYPQLIIPYINPNPAIFQSSADVLKLVCGSFLMFSVITVWFNSVAALGKSNVSFIIEGTSIVVYLICCYLFIVTFDFSVIGVWTVEYIYFGVIGVMSYLYLRSYRKKIGKA